METIELLLVWARGLGPEGLGLALALTLIALYLRKLANALPNPSLQEHLDKFTIAQQETNKQLTLLRQDLATGVKRLEDVWRKVNEP